MLDWIVSMPKEAWNFIDYKAIGEKIKNSEGGLFTEDGYFTCNDKEYAEVYDGEHFPETFEDDKVEELDREMGDTYEVEGEPYLREIKKQVDSYNLEDGERGLARYFGKDNISRNKVYSIKPDVEMVRDTMMGVVAIKMTKPLTQTEIDDLKDYVTGQFSDGWGESFEQHEIQVSGGEIYVHFWDSEEYYINTDEEMEQMLEQNLNEGMQGMQGMSGM